MVLMAVPLAAQDRTIAVGQSMYGELTTHDPVARSRRAPYQVWTLDGRRGQRVQIDLRSQSFDAYLVLRDEDGFVIGSDDDSGDNSDARIHTVLPRNGHYRIVVTGFSEGALGMYALSVSGWEAPDAAPPGQAASIAVGETKDGILEPGDEIAGDGPFQDRWTVALREGQRLRVDLHSSDFDAYLVLLGPDGTQLASDDDSGEGNDASIGFRAATAGTYTVLATSYGDNVHVGAYRLTVAEESGDFAEPGMAASISDGETKAGRLETGDSSGRRGYEDHWTFQGRAGRLARIDVVAPSFDAYAVLLYNGMPLDSNDDGGEGTNARLMTVLPSTGTYTLVVSPYASSSRSGRYTVALAFSDPPPGAGRTERISMGQHASGRLEPGDRQADAGGYQDLWEFDGRAGQDVIIEMHSSELDAYLELHGPDGATVAEDDDSGDGTDAMIVARLPRAGRYQIVARSYGDSRRIGFYDLSVTAGGHVEEPGRVQELRADALVLGRLEAGDSLVGDSTYADVFTFRAPRAGTVRIDLRSGDFDAYLLVKDESGVTLATDDDGGDGVNSRILLPVERGRTYRIYANSYGEDRATGMYRLQLQYEQ